MCSSRLPAATCARTTMAASSYWPLWQLTDLADAVSTRARRRLPGFTLSARDGALAGTAFRRIRRRRFVSIWLRLRMPGTKSTEYSVLVLPKQQMTPTARISVDEPATSSSFSRCRPAWPRTLGLRSPLHLRRLAKRFKPAKPTWSSKSRCQIPFNSGTNPIAPKAAWLATPLKQPYCASKQKRRKRR